ncbi:MAG: hypothetical protein IJH81_05075 [Lachnospiraceae bacterium]|nr:hypothetical protein [Sarcina sp.]MBQ6635723.1 hypothetical protein [Lachnospiraceae bacterium]
MSTENTEMNAQSAEMMDKPEKADKAARKSGSIGKLFGGGKKSSRSKSESSRNTEDDIKKLTRTELLELLIDETKEADRLRAENDRLSEELRKCHEDLDRIASFEAVIARLEAIVNGR